MKRLIPIVSIIVLFMGIFGYFYYQKNHKSKANPQATVSPGLNNTASDDVEASSEEEESPQVEIDPEKLKLMGIKTVEVKKRPLAKLIRTIGRIEYNEKRFVTINTKVEGWIEKLHVDYTGRYVKKGEPLAEIYSPELTATIDELLAAQRWSKDVNSSKAMIAGDTEALIEAARRRLRLWDISDEQIKKIEETGKAKRTVTIYSPVSGYVIEKMAVEGMKVMPGEKLFSLADLSTVWVLADLYEFDMLIIKSGQRATITLSNLPGVNFRARVEYVYPSVSAETRTLKVRFELPNPQERLKPQMFTDVEFKAELGTRLSVPDSAVIETGARQIVYVDKGEGYFEPREIKVGISAEGYKEVLKGLKKGERVASSGTFLIDSEAQLKGITPITKEANQ